MKTQLKQYMNKLKKMVVGVSDDSVTILKFKLGDDYDFKVMDKLVEPDEVLRLDKMMALSQELKLRYGDAYEQLWIKTSPIFAISK